jgi:hypothetical protein
MAAMSTAKAFAQVTGGPAAVIVDVDVGTQVSIVLLVLPEILALIMIGPCWCRARCV